MSIIDSLKRLIHGTSAEPVEQGPVLTVPHPKQAQPSAAGDSEPGFSESYVLAVQRRAETIQKEFNESLRIANLSKNRDERECLLQSARGKLIELKKLTNKFPFLHLTNLQAVEDCIIAVEAETRSLPYGEVVDNSINGAPDNAQCESLTLQGNEIESHGRSGQDRQHHSASIEQAMLICIQSCLRVVNESIVIARKSKNLETKISRLGVARNSLKEAQKQASQFSLKVDGFDAAEAEINRIDEAIKTGTPTEIAGMQQIDVNTEFTSTSRNLLKEATALKREKKYVEACEKLREAYCADGAEDLMIEDRLRLPMYLQLAGKNDEGWDELNRLSAKYVDQFSQPRISHQMTIFLRKENNETASNPVRVILRGDDKPLEATPNESRMKVLEANADVVGRLQWFSAMDGHVCPVCMALSGKEWTNNTDGTHEPVGHSVPFQNPPIHPSCRCVLLPITKTFREMGINIDEPKPGMRASSEGPISSKTTFDEYLKRRTTAQQDEQLGAGRAQMWRDGLITLSQLIDDSARELTLAELRAKYCN